MDGLDTLFIMGLKDEYEQGRSFVANELNMEDIDSEISVFEMNIRFVGGLLSCYAFTKDSIFLTKAEQMAQKLLIAFETPTGIPNAIVNPKQSMTFDNQRNCNYHSSVSFHFRIFQKLHVGFFWKFDLGRVRVSARGVRLLVRSDR